MHQVTLKLGARFHAIGENAQAEAWKLRQPMGIAGIKRYLADPNGFEKARDRVLERAVKPTLLASALPPEHVQIMWRDINRFIEEFRVWIGTNANADQLLPPTPNLKTPPGDDLKGGNYNSPSWSYCDKQGNSEQPGSSGPTEPIPAWKERIIKAGRWVMVAVCVGIAILTCQWQAIFELVKSWIEVEVTVREFCGWACADQA